MAGAAGALYTHYVRIVDPDIFLFIYTVTMVIMVVTGGKGTLAGPIVGGVIFGMLPEVLRSFAIVPELQWVLFGILMILIVFLLPQGIVPAVAAGGGQRQPASRTASRRPTASRPRRGRRRERRACRLRSPVERLSIRFGGLTAVEDMTFEVRDGEVLSLIGPNGAGKTSRLQRHHRLSARRRRRDRATAAGGSPACRPHAIAALGVVRTFQKTSLFGGQSVLDNVLIGLHLRSRQRPLAIMLGLPSVARDEREREAAAWDILRFMALEARARRARRRRCPMASSACSRSRSRSPRGPRCCCSTSRCRA